VPYVVVLPVTTWLICRNRRGGFADINVVILTTTNLLLVPASRSYGRLAGSSSYGSPIERETMRPSRSAPRATAH
jgi:hypothetical protein